MYSRANSSLWAESTAALEEDVSEDAYRLVRKPPKKGEPGGERGNGWDDDFKIFDAQIKVF